jgi:hemerythrin-like domain-containing protein
MTADTLAAALEREHREIDAGIEAFLAALERGAVEREPLERAVQALRRHIFLEEEYLFPPLREAGLFAPIFVMLREHGEIWDTTEALEAQLREGGDGAGDACRRLLEQLDAHNAKEEPIVYPQADTVLTDAAGAGLRAFLEAGRMPDGWVCARAGAAAAAAPPPRPPAA